MNASHKRRFDEKAQKTDTVEISPFCTPLHINSLEDLNFTRSLKRVLIRTRCLVWLEQRGVGLEQRTLFIMWDPLVPFDWFEAFNNNVKKNVFSFFFLLLVKQFGYLTIELLFDYSFWIQ